MLISTGPKRLLNPAIPSCRAYPGFLVGIGQNTLPWSFDAGKSTPVVCHEESVVDRRDAEETRQSVRGVVNHKLADNLKVDLGGEGVDGNRGCERIGGQIGGRIRWWGP